MSDNDIYLLQAVFEEYQRRIDAHFEATDSRVEAHNTLFLAKIEALEELQALGDKMRSMALEQAKSTNDFRLEGMNELRKQINDERGRYVEVKEFAPELKSIHDRLAKIDIKTANQDGRLWMLGVGLGIVFTLVQIGISFLRR